MAIEFHPRIWQVLLLLVIAVGLGIFVIWPAIVGYTVYQEVQKTNYSVDQYGQTLGGLSLDVYEQESRLAEYLRGNRKAPDSKIKAVLAMKEKDNVIFTPHNAFNTVEATANKARLTVEAIEYFFKHKIFPCTVH